MINNKLIELVLIIYITIFSFSLIIKLLVKILVKSNINKLFIYNIILCFIKMFN